MKNKCCKKCNSKCVLTILTIIGVAAFITGIVMLIIKLTKPRDVETDIFDDDDFEDDCCCANDDDFEE